MSYDYASSIHELKMLVIDRSGLHDLYRDNIYKMFISMLHKYPQLNDIIPGNIIKKRQQSVVHKQPCLSYGKI